MKKIELIAFLLGCLMIVPSCTKDPEPEADEKDSIEYLKEDYKTVVKEIPEAEGFFIEAVYELSGKVSENNLDDLKPVKVTYLFQWVGDDDVAYLVSMDRNFLTGKTSEIERGTTSSPWEDTKLGNFDGDDHYMTFYNPSGELLELSGQIASSEGLFIWKHPDISQE